MPELYSLRQAADKLGLSRRRVQDFALEGRIGQRVGRHWVFTGEELAAFRRVPRPPGRPKTG